MDGVIGIFHGSDNKIPLHHGDRIHKVPSLPSRLEYGMMYVSMNPSLFLPSQWTAGP